MSQKLLYLIMPLFLTGCIGSLISGNTGYLNEEYPDIRSVPERPAASAVRGLHKGEETQCRLTDFKELEKIREKLHARDQALREGAFPESQEAKEE